MRQAIRDESKQVSTLDRSRSRLHPAKVICDIDFAYTLKQAQLLLSRVETNVKADWTPYK